MARGYFLENAIAGWLKMWAYKLAVLVCLSIAPSLVLAQTTPPDNRGGSKTTGTSSDQKSPDRAVDGKTNSTTPAEKTTEPPTTRKKKKDGKKKSDKKKSKTLTQKPKEGEKKASEEEDDDEEDEKKPESPFGFEWSVYGGLRFNYTKNFINLTSPPQFNAESIGGGVLAGTEMLGKLGPYVSIKAQIDMGELNFTQTRIGTTSTFGVYLNDYNLLLSAQEQQQIQQAVEQCKQEAREQGLPESDCETAHFLLRESLFIRQLHAIFSFERQQWTQLTVGMYKNQVGRAFILDGYVLGMRLDLNWTKRAGKQSVPWQLEFEAFLPDSSFTSEGKMSPVANLRFSFTRDKDRKVSLFATYMYDGNNLAGKLLLPLWQEYFMVYLSDQVRARAGDSISPSCLNGAFTDSEKTSIMRSFSKTLQTTLEKYKQNTGVDLLDSFYTEMCGRLPSSSGHHGWFGLEGKWHWNHKFFLEGAAIVYASQIRLGLPKGALRFRRDTRSSFRPPTAPGTGDISQPLEVQQTQTGATSVFDTTIEDRTLTGISFASELKFGYQWIPGLTTSAFLLFALGDSFRTNRTQVHAFMGIVPQIRYTDIFFQGGINAYSSRRGLGISGISGKGYVSPGLVVEYASGPDYFRKANGKFTASAYWAIEPSIYKDSTGRSGTFYGAEINLIGGYAFLSWLRAVGQFDFFFPGNFFAASDPVGVSFRVLVGLDFLLFG